MLRLESMFAALASAFVSLPLFANTQVFKINGDSACGPGTSYVSPTEARQNQQELCSRLGTWDIIRLADGGSMDGPGYGCKVRNYDNRSLGGSLCKKNQGFFAVEGDARLIPSLCQDYGGILASLREFKAYQDQACSALSTWYIARTQEGGSVDGPGYACGSRPSDGRTLGHSLCAAYQFELVYRDDSCPAGSRLLSPEEAQSDLQNVCQGLGTWDIARLAGGGSMDGPGYGCKIRNLDDRDLGHSLCTPTR